MLPCQLEASVQVCVLIMVVVDSLLLARLDVAVPVSGWCSSVSVLVMVVVGSLPLAWLSPSG